MKAQPEDIGKGDRIPSVYVPPAAEGVSVPRVASILPMLPSVSSSRSQSSVDLWAFTQETERMTHSPSMQLVRRNAELLAPSSGSFVDATTAFRCGRRIAEMENEPFDQNLDTSSDERSPSASQGFLTANSKLSGFTEPNVQSPSTAQASSETNVGRLFEEEHAPDSQGGLLAPTQPKNICENTLTAGNGSRSPQAILDVSQHYPRDPEQEGKPHQTDIAMQAEETLDSGGSHNRKRKAEDSDAPHLDAIIKAPRLISPDSKSQSKGSLDPILGHAVEEKVKARRRVGGFVIPGLST